VAAAPAALALAGCGRRAESRTVARPAPDAIPLKEAAPFPIGSALNSDLLNDPAYAALIARHVDQITPENETKMWVILGDDGSLDFRRADRLVAFARSHGLRVFGHAFAVYSEKPAVFVRLQDDRKAFEAAFTAYVRTVAGRYAGRFVAWDVINEAVHDDGVRLRGGVFERGLGMDYIPIAFHAAREADPQAVLFLNEYNLEHDGRKRATFLRLAERLLAQGVPLGGLGTQSHMHIDHDPRLVGPAMRELASLGLPIHVSEADVKIRHGRPSLRSDEEALALQARAYGALAEAFADLPERQRFAFTFWGLRDKDNWLKRPDTSRGDPREAPSPLDDQGRPKPAYHAFLQALA